MAKLLCSSPVSIAAWGDDGPLLKGLYLVRGSACSHVNKLM
jgi:hypothetical protein